MANFGLIVHESPPRIFYNDTEKTSDAIENYVAEEQYKRDLDRCETSSFSSFYHRLKANPFPEPYLNYPMSFNRKRLFCQLRLHPDRLKILSLYVEGNQFKFSPTSLCCLCRLQEN